MAVVDSIFAHARTAPDRTAVIFNGEPLGYSVFAGRIAGARAFLTRQALAADRVAVLCIHAPLDAWIIGLAARSLGVTTVHGRSVQDIERLDLGAISLIAAEREAWPGLAGAAALAGSRLILAPDTIDEGAADVGSATGDQPGGHILLTSGTTGTYKKVLVGAVVEAWNVGQRAALYGLTSASVVNVFDFGGWTSVGHHLPVCAWSVGGAVAIHQGPDRWRSLAAPGLSLAYTQPQLLADLLAAPDEAPPRNDDMTLIVTSGPLSPTQWRAARERLTCDVRTCIGSTEAGVVSMTTIETEADLVWHRIDPACRVEVVDDQDRPARTGQTGTVRVRTTGVDGYLGDPDASRAFFRDGYFYPGDLGVLREDGRLSLQGRVTEVINLMGDKIATGPIESTLRDALGAEAVCVFSASDDGAEAVHVAIQTSRAISPAELKAALIAALPGVARVRAHAVEAFPRNHMGKIERATLKARLVPAASA